MYIMIIQRLCTIIYLKNFEINQAKLYTLCLSIFFFSVNHHMYPLAEDNILESGTTTCMAKLFIYSPQPAKLYAC